MKKAFLILIFFTIQFLHSQQDDFVEININAQVLDYETQTGIQFSEVKFLSKNIGALTDDEGNFSVNYLQRSIKNDDVFMISAHGYDTIKTSTFSEIGIKELKKKITGKTISLFSSITVSNAFIDLNLPTNSGAIIFGNITMSLKGKTG